MAQWQATRFEKKQIINQFGDGINTGVPPFNIKESELTYVSNMGSQDYPAISSRYGRTLFSSSTDFTPLTIPNGIGEKNNSQLHAIDGNTWKYWTGSAWSNLTTTLSSTEAEIKDFATGTARYTILMNSTQKFYWDGTSTALVLGDANTPFTKIFTVHKGRIYASSNNTIKYCALNLINDWTTANDSGSITITNARGNITGLTEYNDKVIAFTEYGMHELYGDDPTNFELVDIEGEVGCISDRSIVKCNQKLYWAWIDGIYEYNGASPLKISTPVDSYIKNISYSNRTKVCSGSIGDFLYISIPNSADSNNMLLVYDTVNKKWFTETGTISDFITIQNALYGVNSAGTINNIRSTNYNDNSTAISWELITKPFNAGSVSQKKTLSDISLIYNGEASATMNVGYNTSVSSTNFTSLATSTDFTMDGTEQNQKLLIPTTDLQNVDWFKLQIKGSGKTTIHSLETNYRVKRR